MHAPKVQVVLKKSWIFDRKAKYIQSITQFQVTPSLHIWAVRHLGHGGIQTNGNQSIIPSSLHCAASPDWVKVHVPKENGEAYGVSQVMLCTDSGIINEHTAWVYKGVRDNRGCFDLRENVLGDWEMNTVGSRESAKRVAVSRPQEGPEGSICEVWCATLVEYHLRRSYVWPSSVCACMRMCVGLFMRAFDPWVPVPWR